MSCVLQIHFDSHADMSLPSLFDPNHLWGHFKSDPHEITTYTEINNWVTATWGLGIVDRMVFVEPPWGGEFVPNEHRSLVYTYGEHDGMFKVSIDTPDGQNVNEHYWHTLDDGSTEDVMV